MPLPRMAIIISAGALTLATTLICNSRAPVTYKKYYIEYEIINRCQYVPIYLFIKNKNFTLSFNCWVLSFRLTKIMLNTYVLHIDNLQIYRNLLIKESVYMCIYD